MYNKAGLVSLESIKRKEISPKVRNRLMAPQGDGHHLQHLIVLFFFLIYSPPVLVLGAENSNTSAKNNVRDVKVGVILDTSSWNGAISWSCMQLALEDFYALNPDYKTRISFVLRDLKSGDGSRADPNGDVFAAAVAGLFPSSFSFFVYF